jgi:hypothetical protein
MLGISHVSVVYELAAASNDVDLHDTAPAMLETVARV